MKYLLRYHMRFTRPLWRPIEIAIALLVIAGLTLFCGSVWSQTFPIGRPVLTRAIFCFNMESAKFIAERQALGEDAPLEIIIRSGECVVIQGMATYVKEVFRVRDWRVMEVKFRGLTVWESTDWRTSNEI